MVWEWIQPRFRRDVITAGDSSFLPMLLCSKFVVDMLKVAMHLKGSILLNSPLNPINSSEWDPRLDVDCCGHSMENLSTTPDPNPPLLTIGRMYQQLLLAVAFHFPLPINARNNSLISSCSTTGTSCPPLTVTILTGMGSWFLSGDTTGRVCRTWPSAGFDRTSHVPSEMASYMPQYG